MTMPSPSSIERHPESARLIEAIANGVPGVELARRYGVSESAISRFRVSRKNLLSQIVDEDGTDPTEVIGRLLDLSDSARTTRKLADATSNPTVRSRAIATELAVLDRLSRLNIDDTSTARLAQAAGPLVRTLVKLSKAHPEDVLDAVGQHAELADLHHELKTALKAQKAN